MSWGTGRGANSVNKPPSMSFWKAWIKGIPSWENYRVSIYTKRIVVCGAQGRGYKVGGLSETCVVKTSCKIGCKHVRVMGWREQVAYTAHKVVVGSRIQKSIQLFDNV